MSSNKNQLLIDSVGWDVKNWSRSFTFWEKFLPSDLNGLNSLELGCAYYGGISLWLANKGSTVLCTGYDINLDDVSEKTKIIHKKYNLDEKITYAHLDGTQLDLIEKFDIISFKSTLGGVARNNNLIAAQQFINNIHNALKPGGYLLFSENIKASKVHQLLNNSFGNASKG